MKLIAELEQLGYTFSIHKGKIRYAHSGARPDPSVVRPLLVAMKGNRDEVFSYLHARFGSLVRSTDQLEPIGEACVKPVSGEANPPNPKRGWLHLWNSTLQDLVKRRDDLKVILAKGSISIGKVKEIYGDDSPEFAKALAQVERLRSTIERVDHVLAIRQMAQKLGARQSRPDNVPCWNCKSTRFWVQPACGAWRCAICYPPLPGVDTLDFAPVLHPMTRVNDSGAKELKTKAIRHYKSTATATNPNQNHIAPAGAKEQNQMKVSEMFPSRYLKADDLADGQTLTLTIQSIQRETMGKEKEEKPVLYFKEKGKPFPLNKTNANVIAQLYGDESEDWLDKRITLFVAEVDSFGETVRSIRVRNHVPGAGKKVPASKPLPVPPPAEIEDDELSGSEAIPF